jgi:hypothetical protein
MRDSIVRIGNGILSHRMRIPMELLKCEPSPVPPPAEQAAIVWRLDWANGRLERAIRAKRKVIALLNEQKRAIVHRAVTRGLNPFVPLKPSCVTWLGDIPEALEYTQDDALPKGFWTAFHLRDNLGRRLRGHSSNLFDCRWAGHFRGQSRVERKVRPCQR